MSSLPREAIICQYGPVCLDGAKETTAPLLARVGASRPGWPTALSVFYDSMIAIHNQFRLWCLPYNGVIQHQM